MDLDPDICYRALATRDHRFDGRFFTGVRSTGIFCRPVCPARTPKREHCEFFACAAAAHEAGFRPCRRCRPESAPGTAAWRGTATTVDRALRLIEAGALDSGSVTDLADRLGIGDRHLRRLFVERLGASPLAVAQTQRIHFAKKLVEETSLSMAQVALAAGFRNTRRFNAAVRRAFDRTPTELRAKSTVVDGSRCLTLRLTARGPLDFESMLATLRPRAVPAVERIDASTYRRMVEFGDMRGVVEVRRAPQHPAQVEVRIPVALAPRANAIVQRVRRLFDLDADVAEITSLLAEDPRLGPILNERCVPRVPGSYDEFELVVRAILGQQVSVAAATRLAARLVERYGEPVDEGWARFPSAERLAGADIEALGIPSSRARCLRAVAAACLDAPQRLSLGSSLEDAVRWWTAIPGVGPWTAHYVAMRAHGEPDAFPAADLVLRRLVSTTRRPVTPETLEGMAERWRPFRAYAAMTLWTQASRTQKERS